MKICKARYGGMAFLENDTGIGRNIGYYGEWVQLEIEFLLSLINSGNTVLDVGANIGSHTLAFSKTVGPNGQVFAFEPQDKIFDILNKNIQLNQITNVQLFQLPVGAILGQKVDIPKFTYDEQFNFGGASLKDRFYKEYYQLPTATIDSLYLNECHLIKADVEGFESEVVQGALETVKKHRPFLYLENNRPEQLTNIQMMLHPFGYSIFSHTPPTFNPNNFNKQKDNPWHGNYLEPNMIALPVEKIDLIKSERWLGKRIL